MRVLVSVLVILFSLCAPAYAQVANVQLAAVIPRDDPPGDLSLARREVRRVLGALRACQERRIAQGARVEGTMDITWTTAVAPADSTTEIERRSGEPEAALEACLMAVIRRIAFPEAHTFTVRLLLSAPEPVTPPPVEVDVESMRAEAASTRERARCLSRAASRLERLLAAWDRAGPRGRERLAPQLEEAREAPAMCRSLLDALGTIGDMGTGFGQGIGMGLEDRCPYCRSVAAPMPDTPQ